MSSASTMGELARDLLEGLDGSQRDKACFDVNDAEHRQWFYTPTDHGGLALSEMDSVQHRAVWKLVAAGLSEAGYNTAALIVGQENVLDRVEGFGVDYGRSRGRDPLLYWIAVFGTPAGTGIWRWRFGGHHVSLNFTIVDGRVVSTTPCFFGADPAGVTLLGPHLHRPLGAAEDLGRELVRSLAGEQLAAAHLTQSAPSDLVGGNRTVLAEGDQRMPLPLVWRGRLEQSLDELMQKAQTGLDGALGTSADQLEALAFSRQPKGLSAADMSTDQREVLQHLLLAYIGRISDDLADEQLAKVHQQTEQLHFLWAGGLEPGEPHYYRVQGGDVLIEYDNAPRGGNHVHTVWRDLSMDFGGDPLAEHYTSGAHDH